MDVNIKGALGVVERQAATRREYQQANICKAAVEDIEQLEETIANLKDDILQLGEEHAAGVTTEPDETA